MRARLSRKRVLQHNKLNGMRRGVVVLWCCVSAGVGEGELPYHLRAD